MTLSDRFAKLHAPASGNGNNRKQVNASNQKSKRGANVNQKRGIQNSNDNKKKQVVKGRKTIGKFNNNKVKGGKPASRGGKKGGKFI